MTYPLSDGTETISQEEINKQVQRIFFYPSFSESAILRKFLLFIINETLAGRSNCLKEYTIAVNVLDKPITFKPQENGIVRIHAGRLRRALEQYYNDAGINDEMIIQIPKGKYVPDFCDRKKLAEIANSENEKSDQREHKDETLTLAILPFLSSLEKSIENFADGLCMQLASELMKLSQVSVVAYKAIRNIAEAKSDYSDLYFHFKCNYLVTGCVQQSKDKIRINVNVVDCKNYTEIWSETFERKLNKSNIFTIQDEIIHSISEKVKEISSLKVYHKAPLMALSSAV